MRSIGFAVVPLCALLCLVVPGLSAAADRPTERVSPAPEVNPNAVIWRTPEPPKDPQAGDVWVNPKDGMEMVCIPPGEFILGTSDAQIDAWIKEHPMDEREFFADEQPQCRVRLGGYWIGRTEVANAQYLAFVQATGHPAPEHWKGGQVPSGVESFPVVFVSWEDARAYCQWAGGRLPSELEWEKAARGTDGRIFPWGNEWDRTRCRNFELITGRTYRDTASVEWFQSHSHDLVREGPVAVGSYPAGASAYGCLDMAGNVWEWCADRYDSDAYERYAKGGLTPPASGGFRVLRGGSWYHALVGALPARFRCASRDSAHPVNRSYYFYDCFGFRCVRDAP